eukprot:251012-Amphidinium_carterae.1
MTALAKQAIQPFGVSEESGLLRDEQERARSPILNARNCQPMQHPLKIKSSNTKPATSHQKGYTYVITPPPFGGRVALNAPRTSKASTSVSGM